MKKFNKTHYKYLKFIFDNEHKRAYKNGFKFLDIIKKIHPNMSSNYRPIYIEDDLRLRGFIDNKDFYNTTILTEAGREFVKNNPNLFS